MQAVLSDIHANLEALNAVLADLAQFSVTAIHCLGDSIGYGPNPRECLDLVRGFDTVLRGEVDDLVGSDNATGQTISNQRMIRWTRAELNQPIPASVEPAERWAFLRALRPSHSDHGVLFVHGAPSNQLRGYLFPEDAYNTQKLAREFSLVSGLCFCGHSHLPGYFLQASSGDLVDFVALEGDEIEFHFDGRPLICNVGSVGQPRDGDPRASYALFDGDVIRLRRVTYDWRATIEKMRSNPELNGPT
jgi:diadenosine tetraphosphatase ApaH/serine/threonine PP2A family protein phosphatase